jgi:Domain of unknown function (DUF4136)
MTITFRNWIVLAMLAATVSGCATAPEPASAVRFHSGFAVQAQSIALVPADPALARSLEFASYANALGAKLEALGFKPAAGTTADLIGQISYSETRRAGPPKRSPVSIGVGVGGVGSNVGVSVGSQIGLGGSSESDVSSYELALRLNPAGSTQSVWEGRASVNLSGKGGLATAMPQLINALLSGFPGQSGMTVQVPAAKK